MAIDLQRFGFLLNVSTTKKVEKEIELLLKKIKRSCNIKILIYCNNIFWGESRNHEKSSFEIIARFVKSSINLSMLADL